MYARGLITALLLLIVSCSGPPASPPPAPPPQAALPAGWPEFSNAFIEGYFKANPFFAVQAGRHEFDGQMADWSASGIAAEVARLKSQGQDGQAFARERLTPPEPFEGHNL